jgi:hypothetical protein
VLMKNMGKMWVSRRGPKHIQIRLLGRLWERDPKASFTTASRRHSRGATPRSILSFVHGLQIRETH